MNSIRYSASGRLAFWDTLTEHVDRFKKSLDEILVGHSNAVLESEGHDFVETNDPRVAGITSACDKVIMRGNPTLVDADFERALISDRVGTFFKCFESTGPEIGHQFQESLLPENSNKLLNAAKDLLDLPYRSDDSPLKDPMPLSLKELTSDDEDLFYVKLLEALEPLGFFKVHRQVSIEDLTGKKAHKMPGHLKENRVDFVVHNSRTKWVIEVDGSQHSEPGQAAKDRERDQILRNAGWAVHRISTSAVRDGFDAWIDNLISSTGSDGETQFDKSSDTCSVSQIIQGSIMHEAAFYSVLIPLAAHRCVRCLSQLYYHEILRCDRDQRILVLEEDIPVFAEAMRMLIALWRNICILSPKTLPPPKVKLDIIGDSFLPEIYDTNIEIRNVDTPDGEYDLVLSNSLLLDEGYKGMLECEHSTVFHPYGVRIRSGVGLRSERKLQWFGEPVEYDFPELLRSLSIRSGTAPDDSDESSRQRSALCYMLQLIYRKRDFRDGQLLAISRLLHRLDTVVLLPTGGGKSLVYQLSGMLLPGMTIVIDPIISLMADQVANLKKTGINLLGEVSSTQLANDRDSVVKEMSEGNLAFVFVAPERLQTERFRESLQTRKGTFPISLAVVDEAHCISEWGHDFRPSYLHLPHNLRKYCSENEHHAPTVVGLTGTASFAVLADIQSEMNINSEEAIILPSSFDRPELRFHVETVPRKGKSSALKRYRNQLLPRDLRVNPQNFNRLRGTETNAGLIFCRHVNGDLGVSNVAKELGHRNIYAGKKPRNFDGNWNEHKKSVQESFISNRVQELVTTKSFGMGIDKPNIRYTIHHTMPESVEAFYQEAGRAGRNGIQDYARCAILYSDDNWNAALEIFDEKDHKKALEKLNLINRDNQGDLFTNLWFLLKSYRGLEEEILETFQLWEDHFHRITENLPIGSTDTVLIKFPDSNGREDIERSVYRLVLLGVVDDYTVDWQSRQFKVSVKSVTSEEIEENFVEYWKKYHFEDNAESAISNKSAESVTTTLNHTIKRLVSFVYDEIVLKRKHAIRTMGEMCREFKNDEEFRDAILSYLQESEFSEELRTWLNRPFDEIGLETIEQLLNEVKNLEQVKSLIGTTRRMLDAAPDNIALHYLSVCSRIRNDKESDTNIVDEANSFTRHLSQRRNDINNPHLLLVSLVGEISVFRAELTVSVAYTILRKHGDPPLARAVLADQKIASVPQIRNRAFVLLAANALKTVEGTGYYQSLT